MPVHVHSYYDVFFRWEWNYMKGNTMQWIVREMLPISINFLRSVHAEFLTVVVPSTSTVWNPSLPQEGQRSQRTLPEACQRKGEGYTDDTPYCFQRKNAKCISWKTSASSLNKLFRVLAATAKRSMKGGRWRAEQPRNEHDMAASRQPVVAAAAKRHEQPRKSVDLRWVRDRLHELRAPKGRVDPCPREIQCTVYIYKVCTVNRKGI